VSRIPEKGAALPMLTMGPVGSADLARYADASGDFNPIHLDESYARAQGLDGVIAHGMLTMAYVGRMLTDFARDDADLVEFGVRFRAMVRPGDTIICEGTVTDIREDQGKPLIVVAVTAKNGRGETVVKGSAALRFA
jgi:acyl dehydratase